jgi:hypothetical protein
MNDRHLSGAMPTLGAVLEAASLPGQARILELGGGTRGQKTLKPFLANFEGPVFLVDNEIEKSSARFTRVGADPATAELPCDIDLCIAMPALARIPDTVEGLLYDRIYPALLEGGIVVLLFLRDASSGTLNSIGATAASVRATLQRFLNHHFGTDVIGDSRQVEERFVRCPYFEFVALASRGKSSFTADPLLWLVLRKRAGTSAMRNDQDRAFPRSPRPDQFSLSQLGEFVEALKEADVALVPVDEFAERYEAYRAMRRKQRMQFAACCGHLKFDIHGNVQRALEIATMLHERSTPGLFLMMHRHALNQDFYDSPSTWEMLRQIRAMGHEIGIHADPFYLIRTAGDFHEGLRKALADFTQRGFAVRTATLHGDTREHIKARQLQANDFFGERYRRSKWDGIPPVGEEELAQHVHRYSHHYIADRLGIRFFSEVNFVRDGELLSERPMLYVSDNRRALRIGSIPESVAPFEELAAQVPFVIDRGFVEQAVAILRRCPFLALFHPQWYW